MSVNFQLLLALPHASRFLCSLYFIAAGRRHYDGVVLVAAITSRFGEIQDYV